jgi:hypothetical protein
MGGKGLLRRRASFKDELESLTCLDILRDTLRGGLDLMIGENSGGVRGANSGLMGGIWEGDCESPNGGSLEPSERVGVDGNGLFGICDAGANEVYEDAGEWHLIGADLVEEGFLGADFGFGNCVTSLSKARDCALCAGTGVGVGCGRFGRNVG